MPDSITYWLKPDPHLQAVHVYIAIKAAAAGSGSGGAPDLAAVLSSQAAYVRESLGVDILPASQQPAEEVEVGREEHELGGEEARTEFTLVLTRPVGDSGSGGAAALARQLQQQAL